MALRNDIPYKIIHPITLSRTQMTDPSFPSLRCSEYGRISRIRLAKLEKYLSCCSYKDFLDLQKCGGLS